jgi:hypothetical protein
MRAVDVEAMSEIFQEHGISATIEIIEKVTSDFIGHLDAMREMEITRFMGRQPESSFQKALRLESELNKLKAEFNKISKENKVYHDAIMQKINASEVWIENNSVKYDL